MLTITKQDVQEINHIIYEIMWVNDLIASLREFYHGDDLDKAIDKLRLVHKFNWEIDILGDKFEEIVKRSNLSDEEVYFKIDEYRFNIASYDHYDFYCDICMHKDLCKVLDDIYGANNRSNEGFGGWYTIGYKK
jgi:hypothetical protein